MEFLGDVVDWLCYIVISVIVVVAVCWLCYSWGSFFRWCFANSISCGLT